jgi:hypothetical protein
MKVSSATRCPGKCCARARADSQDQEVERRVPLARRFCFEAVFSVSCYLALSLAAVRPIPPKSSSPQHVLLVLMSLPCCVAHFSCGQPTPDRSSRLSANDNLQRNIEEWVTTNERKGSATSL